MFDPQVGDMVFVCDEGCANLRKKDPSGHLGVVEKIIGKDFYIRYKVPADYRQYFKNDTTSEIVQIDRMRELND